MKKRSVLSDKIGVSSVISALFFLIFVFLVLSIIVFNFLGYNQAIEEQARIEQERAQERIEVSSIGVENEGIYNISISNNGTIEVKIRAIYLIEGNTSRFLLDPSVYIAPSETGLITLSNPEPFASEAKIIASTERGTKSKESPVLRPPPPSIPKDYDTNSLFAGPLMLKFDKFYYESVDEGGTLNPEGWRPGWTIPTSVSYCAWNITIKNIDNSTEYIILDRYSSFTLAPLKSGDLLSWYIEPTELAINEWEQKIPYNETVHVIFLWSTFKVKPSEGGSNKPTKMTLPEGQCMVFLTFFGQVKKVDKKDLIPYGQTIPFEASVTITRK